MPAIEQEPAADQEHEKDSVCYFLVCFSNADFVAFLLASLYREEDYFIIHCDIKGPQSIKDYLVALSRRYNNIHILPSRSYSWAGFSHVQITLEAMSEALCRQQSWSHFCALSEQHLPLKSPTEIASFLRNRRTMLAMRSVQQMGGAEYEDIANRFGAIYRELPGVGCFAVDVADRRELLEKVHHGTNWFAIHRSHCQHLVASLASGEFHQFESIVHAEETAIQTLLAPLASDIELRDVTLVAFPHLTDNHSLVMSDELFEQSIDADYLFIRKRTNQLSSFAHDFVTRNHFEPSVYKLLSGINTDQKAEKRSLAAVDAVAEDIQQRLTRSDPSIHVARVDAREFGSTPKIHLIIKHPGLPNKVNVRLLSENLVDFKVLIDKEQVLPDAFEAPRIRNGFLHSTIRSRIYGLFGYEELLPMSERNRGFLTLGSGQTMAEVVDTAKRFLRAAFNLGGEQAQNGSQTPTVETEPAHHEELGASAPRPQRLNALAKLTGASRYLEIGVSRGETFFEVKVPYKVAVDPNFRFDVQARADAQTIFHQISSDEYFGQIATGEPFDLIYLDGLHTFEQTLRDLLSSMRFAHEQTIWVLDDTIPTNAFASLPSEHECWELKKKAGIDDWSWMGDVYKVVFFVARMMPSLQFRTYTGHGQTVIWKGKSTRTIASSPSLPAAEIGMMTYDVMLRHLDEMLMTEEDEILQAIHADLIR